ncbi:MAG: hypothetical protein A4E49_03183 [Methanosaeta sp. PtaU1.Bin112]|nr:MAG: hypothetical protein A4E49_03183 [Methanosaeta sp. PtaU1.Bin112]
MNLSITNAALAIYPLSSRMERARKRTNIGGKKNSTDPRPPMTAVLTKDARYGSDIAWSETAPRSSKAFSMMTTNGSETANANWNMVQRMVRNIGMLRYLFRNTWSSISVKVKISSRSFRTAASTIDAIFSYLLCAKAELRFSEYSLILMPPRRIVLC